MIFTYKGRQPHLGENVFLAEGACVIGDVRIGAESSLWFNVVVRGDVNHIRIGRRTNIQDGSVVHVTRDTHPTIIGNNVTVGHRATLHGCTVGDGVLIGIGATVLDGAEIGESSLVAAGTLVAPGTKVPPRSLVMGVPAKVKRQLSDDECQKFKALAESYVAYSAEYLSNVERIG